MTRLQTSGLVALAFAGICRLAEASFYGGVDYRAVLQESFFLPLSVILATIGFVLISVSLIARVFG